MLASKDQLKAIVEGYLLGSMPDVLVLSGWRREMVGQELIDLLSGDLRIQVDPQTGRLSTVRDAALKPT
jgi:hypothetical protein